MELNQQISKNNYYSFLWHATFLALAQNFMDINTVVPAMMVDAGGTSLHIGILTAIMVGGGKIAQLIFAPFLSNKSLKKKYLLIGINTRVLALLGIGFLFIFSDLVGSGFIITAIFVLIFLFAISGGFANINYTDILGKSILQSKRKPFFSIKQVVTSLGVLVSAYFARNILRTHSYPNNYAIMFIIATTLLGFATLGFWKIKEVTAEKLRIQNFKEFLEITINEFKDNRRLSSYLIILNTQGLTLIIMPFLILYAKETFGAGNSAIGNYLLLKVVGGVLTGSLLFYYAKQIRYHYLLYLTSFLGILLPISLIIFPGKILFPYIFLLGGVVYAFHRVIISGILLEVTNNKNRAFYTGLSGAGNLLPVIFPLFGGLIINIFGFNIFFLLIIFVLTSSFYFIYKLNCQK